MKTILQKTYFFIFFILFSCYGVNKKTSHILVFIPYCVDKMVWEDLTNRYSIESISKIEFKQKIMDFQEMPFKSELLYFKDGPEEIIGLDATHIGIRYVFNPKISSKILDGLSPELSKEEKKRIRNRVLTLFLQYQCEKGKQRTIEEMSKEIKD